MRYPTTKYNPFGKLLPYFILLISSLSFYNCTERISISTKNAEERLIIYGYITTDTMAHTIRISRSMGYFEERGQERIRGARVTISTKDSLYILEEHPIFLGVYQTPPYVYGIEGETYTLNVWVDFNGDGNNEHYRATSFLPYAVKLDSVALQESIVLQDRIEVLIYGELPSLEDNYMSLHLFRNFTDAINDSLSHFTVIDGKYIGKTEIDGVPCYYLDQTNDRSKLYPNDTLTVKVDMITREYAEFIWNAQSEVNGTFPIFSAPPANVQTNITKTNNENQILVSGFFTAYSTRRNHAAVNFDLISRWQ